MKWSPTTIVVTLIAAVVVLYGGYKLMNPVNKTSTPQSTTQQQTASPAAMAKEMTVYLLAENDSGESGTAVLKEEDGKTRVTLTLTGFIKDVEQPAHIHVGACPGVGAVKYPLTNVVNGNSATLLSVTLDELKKSLPLAINVHKSAKDVTIYTSCGELSSK